MMKKYCLTFLFLAAFFLLTPALVTLLEVSVEPPNSFYSRHSKQCLFLGESFYANGEIGYVSVKKAPDSKKEVAAVKNGEVLFISFLYRHDGEIWGLTVASEADEPASGWLPMAQLMTVYDYSSFADENQDELYSYTGDYEELKTAEKPIIFWSWPGSGVEMGTIRAYKIDETFTIAHAYTKVHNTVF